MKEPVGEGAGRGHSAAAATGAALTGPETAAGEATDTVRGRPFVLAVVGDSGSGKNTVASAVAGLLGHQRVTHLRLDDYHRYTREERADRGLTALNPLVHNFTLMREHLDLLRRGRSIRNRGYNHADGSFDPIREIVPREVVLARGLLGYCTEELQSLYDLTVFLRPEPELLFRWKLRRDVLFRGYTEAEVLKSIAEHLLDAKEFVLPQAQRSHLLVNYALPDWEAPDSAVRTTLYLRREAAVCVRQTDPFAGLPVDQVETEGELVVTIPATLDRESVDGWAADRFPQAYLAGEFGSDVDDRGQSVRRPSLVVVEVLIAHLARRMAHPAAV